MIKEIGETASIQVFEGDTKYSISCLLGLNRSTVLSDRVVCAKGKAHDSETTINVPMYQYVAINGVPVFVQCTITRCRAFEFELFSHTTSILNDLKRIQNDYSKT